MDFGIALATTTDSWRAVQRAEELGFTHAWFYDTQLLNPDVFMGMTQAAMVTERIRLGTGVLIPSNRIEPVTANCLATLNRLAPGRVDFGVGTGFTARRTMGLDAIRLKRFRTYLERVRALLRGETIEWDFEGEDRRIAFLNPDYGLIDLDHPIPLHVSGFGPRTRRLAAELGAGWLNFTADVERACRDLVDVRGSWREAGNDGDPYSTLFTMGAVLRDGDTVDDARIREQSAPFAAVFLHNLAETTTSEQSARMLPPLLQERLEAYRAEYARYDAEAPWLRNHRGHLMHLREEEEAIVDGEMIRALTFTGTPDELRAKVDRLAEAGYSQVTVQLVDAHFDALDDWARVFGLT
jgi:5,10-methylenetetrahydromethanopterin reductase